MTYSANNLPSDKTDWARVKAMSDTSLVANAKSDRDSIVLTKKIMKRAKLIKPQSVL